MGKTESSDSKLSVLGKRRLTTLRKDLIDTRKKWEKVVAGASFGHQSFRPLVSGSPLAGGRAKVMYFVREEFHGESAWIQDMREEFEELDKRVVRAGYAEMRPQTGLWIPRLIWNPLRIECITYYSRRADVIERRAAQVFLRRTKIRQALDDREYFLVRRVSAERRLAVTSKEGTVEVFKVPEWSVCFVASGDDMLKIVQKRVKPNKLYQAPQTVKRRDVDVIAQAGTTFLVRFRKDLANADICEEDDDF
jgi:hypothetical protein